MVKSPRQVCGMWILRSAIIQQLITVNMHSFKSQGHHCQIDCTNHDEIKSKDLYYFWRNYEWLYNKYYSQPQPRQEESAISARQLEEEISRLESQNKTLRIENQTLKRQMQAQTHGSSAKVEQDYKREIDRLNSKCRDYQSIREKMSSEISGLKSRIRSLEEELDEQQSKHKREIKKKDSTIIQLQQNIDELRAKMLKGSSDSNGQIHEKYRREMHKMKVMMGSLEQRAGEIIEDEFQSMRVDLLNEFPRMFTSFSRSNMAGIIVEEIEGEE